MTAALHPPTLSLPPPSSAPPPPPIYTHRVLPTCLAGDVGMGEDPGGCLCARQTLKVGGCPPTPKIFQGPRGALKAAAGWGAPARSTAQGSALLAGAGSAPCIARSTECTQGAWVQGALRQPGEGWGGPGKDGAPALCPARSWGWRGDLRTGGGVGGKGVFNDPTPPVPAETHQEHSVCH